LQTRTAKRWLSPSFGFGLTHTPEKPQELDRKNTVVGKVRGKAATDSQQGFGASGALSRGDSYFAIFAARLAFKDCWEAPPAAKPQIVRGNAGKCQAIKQQINTVT